MLVSTTKVQPIGPEAELFKEEKMVILFGKSAPDALANYCYNIEVQPVTETITNKQTLVTDEQTYQTIAAGEVVSINLDVLGHITIKFDGVTTPELPGTLYVEEKAIPEIIVGITITILQLSFRGGM